MRKDIIAFVKRCMVCAQTKGTTTPEPPHSLPTPAGPWQDVTVDLVTGLPQINGINGVCTVVDQFLKEMVVFPIPHNITSKELACEYRDRVWRMHGTPISILSDHGLQFISAFT